MTPKTHEQGFSMTIPIASLWTGPRGQYPLAHDHLGCLIDLVIATPQPHILCRAWTLPEDGDPLEVTAQVERMVKICLTSAVEN